MRIGHYPMARRLRFTYEDQGMTLNDHAVIKGKYTLDDGDGSWLMAVTDDRRCTVALEPGAIGFGPT